MDIKLVHFMVKQELNKLDSAAFEDISPATIDEFLNKAQLIKIKEKIDYKTNHGFELDTKLTSDLAPLVIKSPSVLQGGVTPTTTLDTGVYECKMYTTGKGGLLNFDMMYPVSITIDAVKNNCTKRIRVFTREQDDKQYSNKESSFLQSTCIGYFARGDQAITPTTTQADRISLYLDTQSDFTISKVYPVFIKFPNRVCLGGYKDQNGNTLNASYFEFPEQMVYEIISKAVELISASIQLPDVQVKSFIDKTTAQD